jgi:hypothetical protein
VRIEPYFVTFGVQYTGNPATGDMHPLGMTKDNYVVIEAPSMAMAQRIADAIFGQTYSFLYDSAHFMEDGTYDRWYLDNPDAHALTIKWAEQPVKPIVIQAPQELLDQIRTVATIMPMPEQGVMYLPDTVKVTCNTTNPRTGMVCNEPPHYGDKHWTTTEDGQRYDWYVKEEQ